MKRILQSLWLAILLMGCPGCTPLSGIQAFGKSAREVSAAAKDGYARFNMNYTDARRDIAIIKGKMLRLEDMRQVLDQETRGPARTNALDQLASYATALEALAAKDPSADQKAAALDIKGSLTALNTQSAALGGGSPFSSADISTLSGLFTAAANMEMQLQREQALRDIIIRADVGVQKIGALLKNEFPKLGGALQAQLISAADEYRDYLNQSPAPALSLQEKLAIGRDAQKVQSGADAAHGAYQSVADAAAKMAKAHAQLASAAKGGKLTDEQTVAAVGEFVSKANATKKLFEDVSKP
jgi:hypothetical protein